MQTKLFRMMTALYMAALFYVASIPYTAALGTSQGHRIFYNGLHIPMYAILTYLAIRSFARISKWVIVLSALFSISYGALIEYYQNFVPNRSASWGDIGLNTLGVLFVMLLFHLRKRA